jgi:hypothetical protein
MTAQNLSEKNKKEGCCSCSLDLNHVSCIAPPDGWSWTLKKKDPQNKQPLEKTTTTSICPNPPTTQQENTQTNKKGGWQGNKTGGEMMNQQIKQKSFLSLSLSLSLSLFLSLSLSHFVSKGEPGTESLDPTTEITQNCCSLFCSRVMCECVFVALHLGFPNSSLFSSFFFGFSPFFQSTINTPTLLPLVAHFLHLLA